jgi:hypothetical protein
LIKKIRLFKDTIQTQIDDRFLGFKSESHTLKDRIQEMEKHKQSTQEGENKLDIKPIKEEMNKLIETMSVTK